MRAVAVVLCALGIAGCDEHVAGPSAPIVRDIVLAPRQTVVIAEVGLSVRFTAVLEDSRCPADAICVRAGEGIIRFEVTPPSAGRAAYDLRTDDPKPTRHGEVGIALVNLAPYPMHSRPTPPDDYRATLRITR